MAQFLHKSPRIYVVVSLSLDQIICLYAFCLKKKKLVKENSQFFLKGGTFLSRHVSAGAITALHAVGEEQIVRG